MAKFAITLWWVLFKAGHRQGKKWATVDNCNQQPTPDNQNQPQPQTVTSASQQSALDNEQPTINNKQLPPDRYTRHLNNQQSKIKKDKVGSNNPKNYASFVTNMKPTASGREWHYISLIIRHYRWQTFRIRQRLVDKTTLYITWKPMTDNVDRQIPYRIRRIVSYSS